MATEQITGQSDWSNSRTCFKKPGLPDVVLASDRAWAVFLQEGCFQGAKNTPLIDAMSYLSETQQAALHELLSMLLTEQERMREFALVGSRFTLAKEVAFELLCRGMSVETLKGQPSK